MGEYEWAMSSRMAKNPKSPYQERLDFQEREELGILEDYIKSKTRWMTQEEQDRLLYLRKILKK